MEVLMMGSSMRTTLRDKEFINGQMAETMKVNGRTIKWRAMVSSHGLMAEDMRENISMIKKKAMEYFTGKSINFDSLFY